MSSFILFYFGYSLMETYLINCQWMSLKSNYPFQSQTSGRPSVVPEVGYWSQAPPRSRSSTHHPEPEQGGAELAVREWWSPWTAPILGKWLAWCGPPSEPLYWDTARPGNIKTLSWMTTKFIYVLDINQAKLFAFICGLQLKHSCSPLEERYVDHINDKCLPVYQKWQRIH